MQKMTAIIPKSCAILVREKNKARKSKCRHGIQRKGMAVEENHHLKDKTKS